ncbi:ThiF family adenylyltransferase [Yersinia enterocolitica]
MNYSYILEHLTACGYEVSAVSFGPNNADALRVNIRVAEHNLSLLHLCINELTELPDFILESSSQYGRLAHTTVHEQFDLATICVNVPDSVSVNYDRPELAFEESLTRYTKLLTQLIQDPEWNKYELIREFQAGWYNIVESADDHFLCLSERGEVEELKILKPQPKAHMGLATYYFGIPFNWTEDYVFSPIARQLNSRERSSGRGYVIPLTNVDPAPRSKEELGAWYLNLLASLSSETYTLLSQNITQWREREFWVIFNAQTPSGKTWFGIHFARKNSSQGKKRLPLSEPELTSWTLKAVAVSLFNKERLMPRSGANQELQNKKVLLIGCGSVGGEIADKLAASGVGEITLSDPDKFSMDNIYRHILSLNYVSHLKTISLNLHLTNKYPWLRVKNFNKSLLELRNERFLEKFDIIVIAIGAPTHERLFHDFLLKNKITSAVINTWVEGYGVGGHAILDISYTQGCLHCAYVDPMDLSRGLASNLNFLEKNQDITRNHAGCGDTFLPYTYITSTQTALIAADLAIKYLLKRVQHSSKVSWKGDATEALQNGFNLTERYNVFNRSLEITPLYNNECDICNEK